MTPQEQREAAVPAELKRYDFEWGYVGIEQREDEYGDWVRYGDALAFYSKELDRAYAEGRKDEREQILEEMRVAREKLDAAIARLEP